MNAIEKLAEQINGIPNPKEYVLEMVNVILARNGLTPDDLSGHLEAYGKRSAELLRSLDFAKLPGVVADLEQKAREVKIAHARPTEGQAKASRESIHARAAGCGWIAEEIDSLLAIAGPSAITLITWRSATVNGHEIDRGELRQSLRSAAYSNAGWEKRLSEMPRIAAPTEEPR